MKAPKRILILTAVIASFSFIIACDGETPEQKKAYETAQQQRGAQRPGTPQGQPGVAPGTEKEAGN